MATVGGRLKESAWLVFFAPTEKVKSGHTFPAEPAPPLQTGAPARSVRIACPSTMATLSGWKRSGSAMPLRVQRLA
ncbi:hypothetical protein PIIN_09688 [Serendipita indica DSM 11827]|uniref:Uncharacterized protein n=1 Tax=Serendipita indica (strain DSM 11827) TaxID=1109443 RepID=G4TWK5_SERID|nr:hypothetical protein PIIN_09688 [Serendipita indica DSM 11827]